MRCNREEVRLQSRFSVRNPAKIGSMYPREPCPEQHKQRLRQEEELEYLGPANIEAEASILQSPRRLDMRLPLDFPIVQWGEFFTVTFIIIPTSWRLCENSPNATLILGGGVSRKRSWERNCFFSDEAHVDASINRTCATGLTPIFEKSFEFT